MENDLINDIESIESKIRDIKEYGYDEELDDMTLEELEEELENLKYELRVTEELYVDDGAPDYDDYSESSFP